MSTNGIDRPISLSAEERSRFQKKVRRGGPNDCWPYMGGKFKNGYGQVYAVVDGKKRNLRSNRVAWFIEHGEIPPGMDVCHQCDNPPCCNPAHLWLGTYKQNNDDKVAKGRQVMGPDHRGLVRATCSRGNELPHAKLDEAKVREARRRYDGGEKIASLARAFGVRPQSMRKVVKRKSWTHVGDGS